MPPAPYTVTNSFKGGLMMRTYARNVRRAWDGEDYPIAKRICVEKPKIRDENDDNNLERAIRESSAAISSSPSRKNSTIFSGESYDDDNDNDTITPPSSPPPRLSPPAGKAHKPAFSYLKRKRESTREESEPLAELINSSSRASVPPKKPQNLVQMQLDLGADTRKTCGECGMEYVPSNDEDATLHRMYHNMNSDGVELGKSFMKSAMKWVYEVAHIEGSVVVVDRKISPPAKKAVQKVLGVVNKELSAADIQDDVLWSQRSLSEGGGSSSSGGGGGGGGNVQGVVKQSEAEKRNDNKSDRYKIFLHVKNKKCVGLCLAERITKAHRVTDNKKPEAGGHELLSHHKSSSISIDEEAVPAVVGVSRIWTSKSSRRKGIANNLLDCVLNQFIYGMEVGKDELAFSQPTESGGELAKAWYGEQSGWLVYTED